MNHELRNLLDKVYELEGLVHLALKRDDSSEDFIRLISIKGKEIGELSSAFKTLKPKTTPETNLNKNESFSFDEYSIDDISDSMTSASISEIREIPNERKISYKSNEVEKQRGKLVFSINERFRFRKELFDNSDADFNNNLALVASMENYDEAEDYFINEEGFDPDNKVVKEFLEVIKRYFR